MGCLPEWRGLYVARWVAARGDEGTHPQVEREGSIKEGPLRKAAPTSSKTTTAPSANLKRCLRRRAEQRLARGAEAAFAIAACGRRKRRACRGGIRGAK